ncbi:unnamed protein product [Linum tenue]|uniref:Uncharacterized protein n=1 Tax=Linum tenue TaxID=586396 RepID=A0AAV0RI81_9ROSI|nr:unnamed protein product [Linum tenue]
MEVGCIHGLEVLGIINEPTDA